MGGTGPRRAAMRIGGGLIAVVVLMLTAATAFAAHDAVERVVVDGVSGQYRLAGRMELHVSDRDDMSASAVAAAPFQHYDGAFPSFGITDKTYWFRVVLDNPGTEPRPLALEVASVWLDMVELYDPQGHRHAAGDRRPFAARDLTHPNFVFLFDAPPGMSAAYLKLKTDDLLMAPIALWDEQAFLAKDRLWWMYYGLLFGTLVVMLLYNLFIYFSMRDGAYLYYVAYLATFTFMCLTYNGFSYQFLWPEAPAFANWAQFVGITMYMAAGLSFTVKFLGTRTNLPGWHKTIVGFAALVAVYVAGAVAYNDFGIAIQTMMVVLNTYSLLLIAVGVVAFRAKVPAARFFMLASVISVFGVAITSSVTLSLIPYTFLTYHAAEFGIMADVVLLSLALADRINTLREEKERAEMKVVAALQKARFELEDKVAARTAALNAARKNAERLASTDDLTGLGNRRAFMDALSREIARAQRTARPLSIVAMDIDHFKAINDAHGHAAGDSVLKAFADVIRGCLREMDVAGRVGGEEFTVCLPDTDLGAALTVAERIRARTETTHVTHGRTRIPVTTSIGVAAHDGVSETTLDALLAEADRYLYEAKDAGRNTIAAANGNGQDGMEPEPAGA